MIQECLLLQEGKRRALSASLPAAQAMARQQVQVIRSASASDPARVSFETYLSVNHLTEQTFLTDPRILHGFVDTLTMAAGKQHSPVRVPPRQPRAHATSAYS